MPRIVKPAEERKAEITEAAMNLFITQGYEATTVNDVIAAVGISKGAFYHHFTAKEDLLEAIARQHVLQTAADAQSVLEDPTLDSFARLKCFLEQARKRKENESLRIMRTFETLFRVDNVPLFHRIHTAMIEVVKPILTRIITEGVAEQTFDTPSPEWAADTILLLGASNREAVAAIFTAAGEAERETAIAELAERMRFTAITIDRILGLPDGSLDACDDDFLRALSTGSQYRQATAAA